MSTLKINLMPKQEEKFKLWQSLFKTVGIDAKLVDFSERDGMQDGRIFYYDEKKNCYTNSTRRVESGIRLFRLPICRQYRGV